MAKKVSDAMTVRPRAVRPDAMVQEAAGIMDVEDVGSLPVIDDGGRLIGIVTDRDITVRATAQGRDPRTTPVAEVVSGDPVTVSAEDDLEEAMNVMAQHRVRRLPVVEGEILVGMLAQADVAREARERNVGDLVEAISMPNAGPRVELG